MARARLFAMRVVEALGQAHVAPVVSSTSSIGGFSPGPQASGLFSWRGGSLIMPRRIRRHALKSPKSPGCHAPGAAGPDRANARPCLTPCQTRAPRRRRIDYLQEDPDRTRLRRRDRVRRSSPRATCRAGSGNHVLLKREDQQAGVQLQAAWVPTTRWRTCRRSNSLRGVICASAGNHAQGVALGARRLGCKAHDRDAGDDATLKVDGGAGARRRGGAARRQLLRRLRPCARAAGEEQGLTFVHPFDDPDVIAGQGTVAMEILRQHQGPLDAVFVRHRRRRPDLRRGRLHQGRAARGQGDRRADRRFRCHGAVGARRQARAARPTSACSPTAPPSSWWARRPSACARELVDEFVVVDTDAGLRRHQGRVPGHPQHPRTLRRDGRRRDQAVRRARHKAEGQDPGRRSPAART